MNIEPRIEVIEGIKLVGMQRKMSLANNQTAELWRSFMPRRKEIAQQQSTELYSLQLYNNYYFEQFDATTEFEKWAAVAVTAFSTIPDGMQKLIVPAGRYAIFHYVGSNTDPSIFRYIFREWLPASEYRLDNRPHFELLGEKYRNGSAESEEEIYIPVTPKSQS